jgi:hypothetical protein
VLNTYQSIVINEPIKNIWDRVKNFYDMSWTPNVITKCVADGDISGTEVGAKRILNDVFYETLIELNEDEYRIRYSIDNGPSPVSQGEVSNYIGHLHLLPITKDNSTFIEWSSSWESDSQEAVEFCHNIYVALLDDLAASSK